MIYSFGTSFFSSWLCYFPHTRYSSYTVSSVCLSYFILAVPMRECLGKPIEHEFPISYNHTEWYLIFVYETHDRNCRSIACQKLTIIITGMVAVKCVHYQLNQYMVVYVIASMHSRKSVLPIRSIFDCACVLCT